MSFRALTARFALLVALCLATSVPAMAKKSSFLQCVPFAREVSGIDIRGNAWTWWSQAEGRYERGNEPEVGSVMSFKKTGRNPYGHVAMVSAIISDREVLLTHANWSYRGGIERNVRAIDVSPAGDWSQVKVWFAPTGGMGTTVFPVNGFIYPDDAPKAFEAPQMIAARKPERPLILASMMGKTSL
ncbi:CHAP domain-containing protein [Sphingomonas sp. G-3-2-10]|jgi:surface antigen|uniref:CHAP domain-containing protein n=1 Tax=Sphingomonas sp. G-3-2-10 TaxID=2728838 RepID=UPI00146A54B9|nr:CHAP domain-containing protein [Sphingomonas sp. G-3-2-10]NML06592.1 CHAP domain-containing protein [Sphingomonas sp. G-3-2-10]